MGTIELDNKLQALKAEWRQSLKLVLKRANRLGEEILASWITVQRINEMECKVIDASILKNFWLESTIETKFVHLCEGKELKVRRSNGHCVTFIIESISVLNNQNKNNENNRK